MKGPGPAAAAGGRASRVDGITDQLTERLRAAGLDPQQVARLVAAALEEDLGGGSDVTSEATIPATAVGTARLVARADGVAAGLPVAEMVFQVAAARTAGAADGGELAVEPFRVSYDTCDGERVRRGQALLTVSGDVRALLMAERTVLNLVCHLSGVATLTRRWVDEVAGTGARIRDTRKTLPGLRLLQKYAVRCGGGLNHRMSLSDAVLVKDNHAAAAGGVAAAFAAVRAAVGGAVAGGAVAGGAAVGGAVAGGAAVGGAVAGGAAAGGAAAGGLPVEVECDTLAQVAAVADLGAKLILLDNFTLADTARAVAIVAGRAQLEASGGLTLENARAVAATGVDFLAVGALTHSAPALDIGLDLAPGTPVT
jgi:nicotinate-nucleotide pyrophosphorylase (carboxylating)